MIWHRLVFLLLLPLGLGGCWDLSTRPSSPSTVPYAQGGLSSPVGDDLPTPRFFQIERSTGPSE
jgi:hypothetical protein